MFNHILSTRNTQGNPAKTSHPQHLRRLRGLRRTIRHAIARGDFRLARDLAEIAVRMAGGVAR